MACAPQLEGSWYIKEDQAQPKKPIFLNQTAFKAQLHHTLAIEPGTLPLTSLILNDPPEKGNIIVPTFKGFRED